MPDLSGFIHGCLAALCRASVEGGVALLLVFLFCRLTPRLSPTLHAWLWRLAYAKLLLALFCPFTVRLPLLPARSAYLPTQPVLARPKPATEAEPMPAFVPAAPTTASISALPPFSPKPYSPPDLSGLLLACWTLGAAAAALGRARRYRAMRQFRRMANAASDPELPLEVDRLSAELRVRLPPAVLITPGLSGPLVTGGFRPVILLPDSALEELQPEALRLLLAHELAHLRRRDLLWAWLPALAGALFFFHPLVWLAEREWHATTESACDEQVLSLDEARPATYARLLLSVASAQPAHRHSPALAALGAADSHYLVRRRLLQMKHLKPLTHTSVVRWGLALALVGLLGLVPWRVAAQTESGDRNTRLALQWEDVLLLEATRYLQLTPAQLQKLRPLVQIMEERLARLKAEEEGTVSTLEHLARRQRESLASGQPVPASESEQVVTLGLTLQRRREQAQSEIVQMIAPRLARILTPKQIQRAYLLSLGEALPQEVKSPPLWDPKAGFIVDGNTASEWREGVIKQTLYQRFPPKLVDSLQGANSSFMATAYLAMIGDLRGEANKDWVFSSSRPAGGTPMRFPKLSVKNQHSMLFRYPSVKNVYLDNSRITPNDPANDFPEDLRQQAQAEDNRLRDRLANLGQLIPSGASEQERALALQPLTRRLFLSPRIRPALNARLGGSAAD